VWMGCQGGNLMIYDTSTRSTRFLQDPVFKGSTIRYITGDENGQILFGTFQGDIIRFDGKHFEVIQSLGSMVHKMMIDRAGKLWASADNNGLFCLSPDGRNIIWHFTAGHNDGHSLFANTGRDIEQLNDSTIVFGADAMNFIDTRTGRVRWLTVDQGLPGNTIQRMRMDGNGYLWMITLNGLCRYNPATGRITSYNRKDGILVSNLTTEADCFTRDGVMMFTGLNAILYFKPSAFRNTSPPDVTITDCKLFNDYLPVDSLLRLPEINLGPAQNSLSIYFAALSYLKREKLSYYYKMSGIDNEWLKADHQNYVNYSLLPPGHYSFMVYCENIDGVRSAHITQIRLYIRPPFWQTGWFIGLVLVSLSGIAYFIHRLRINRLLAVEKVRNRVARDLHDDMGSTLSTINILSAMARTRMQSDPVKTQEYLGKISDNSQRMMEAMDDIVWSIKPSNDSMHKMTARMREFAVNLLEPKDIAIKFAVGDKIDELKLDMEARRDLFLVFKEAVNNAAKYAHAGWVSIRLEKLPGFLSLIVEDNGIGFAVDSADNGNGLGNMRKRASALHGTLSIQSASGQGTRVSLLVPIVS
nr:triple tyrosine motif-containing protein [Sediminibacterium sp.]